MNDSDLEKIWKDLENFMDKKEEIIKKCCDNKENIVSYSDGFTCKVCGIMSDSNITDSVFSDHHSVMIDGMSGSISRHPLSRKLMMTNYKSNNTGNKTFKNQKNNWDLKCHFIEKIDGSQCGIQENIIVCAIELFRMFEATPGKKGEKTIVRRNVRTSVISACLYLSCKKHDSFRSPIEIAEIMNIDKSLVIKGCKILREKLNDKNTKQVDISQIIPRVCSDLTLPFGFQKETIALYNSQDLYEMQKYDPRIVCAALLYIVCIKNNISGEIKKDIALTLGVSEISMGRLINIIK